MKWRGRRETNQIGPRDRAKGKVLMLMMLMALLLVEWSVHPTLHPRHCRSVIEAQHELRSNAHASFNTLDDANEPRPIVANRHEVDDANHAFIACVLRFERE